MSENIKNEKGQTFMEFLLLLLVIISLSYVFIGGIGRNISTQWIKIVKKVTAPTDSNIRLE